MKTYTFEASFENKSLDSRITLPVIEFDTPSCFVSHCVKQFGLDYLMRHHAVVYIYENSVSNGTGVIGCLNFVSFNS